MKKATVTALIFGLLISPSLALNSSFSSGSSQSLSTIVQALTEGKWLEVADTNWYDSVIQKNADATEFTISNAKQLAGLAKLVNDGTDNFEGKTILLTNDIDLSEYQWVPIGGSLTLPFKGTFNGQEYTIKNMLIGTEDELANYTYAGLFGYVYGATIENVNIDENCKIYNNYSSGGICAYASNSTIINCTNNGIVSSNNTSAGGICSQARQTKIINCINSGMVYAYNGYVGGICAWDKQTTTIVNCLNIETVLSNGGKNPNIGGICGKASDETTIKNNYYQEGTAAKGIGNKDADDQEGATALPESQMKAASEMDSSSGIVDTSWKEIKISYEKVNINLEQMPLVDALNVGAYIYNRESKGKNPKIETALKWEIRSDENSGYPVLKNSADTDESTNTTAIEEESATENVADNYTG